MNYSLFLARRLALSSTGRKSSPAVRVATAAVALSVVVMMAAISIVLGFKREIVGKLEGFNADLTVAAVSPAISSSSSDDNANILNLSPTLREIIASRPYVADVSLQIAAPAILKTSEDFKGVYLKSLSGSHITRLLSESLDEGEMPAFLNTDADSDASLPDSIANQILISRIDADKLRLNAGDKIDVYFITDQVRVRRLKISGIFNTHFDSYDDIYIFGSSETLRSVSSLRPGQGTQISIVTRPGTDIEAAGADLQYALVKAYEEERIYKPLRVETLRSSGGNFFQWLQMLDMNVVIILSLMTVVAAATLVSGMLIVIVDKKRFIALMKALGMPGRPLRRVFIYVAVRVALVGLLIGDAIALLLLWIQQHTHLIPLDADSYYIDFVPVEFSWPAFALLNVGVLVVSYIVLILPARFIGSISPSAVLSSE